MAALVQIQQRLLEGDRSDGYTGVLELIGQVTGASCAYILSKTLDIESSPFQLVATWYIDDSAFMPPDLTHHPVNQLLLHQLNPLQQGDVLLLSGSALSETEQAVVSAQAIATTLVLPLISQGRLIGVLGIDDRDPYQWEPFEIDCLRAIAGSLVLAYERQVSQQTQRQQHHEMCQLRDRLETALSERTAMLAEMDRVLSCEVLIRQEIEKTLQHSEDKFHILVQNSSDVVSVMTLAGEVRYVSSKSDAVLGIAPQALTQTNYFERLHPHDRPRVMAVLHDLVHHPHKSVVFDYRLRQADGSWRYLESWAIDGRANPLLQGILVNTRERTEPRRDEVALPRVQWPSGDGLEQRSDACLMFDRAGYLMDMTPAAEQFLGCDRHALVGQWIGDVFINARQSLFYQTYHQAIANPSSIRLVAFCPHFQTWLELQVDPSVAGVLIYFQDMGDRQASCGPLQCQPLRERALYRVVQVIRQSLDLETIFKTAVYELGQLMQAQIATIVQYLPDQQTWLTQAEYRQNTALPSHLGTAIPDQANPLAERLKRCEMVQIDDTSQLTDAVNQTLAEVYPGSWLLIPLQVGGQSEAAWVWGSFSMVRQTQPSRWEAWEVELARAVADQLAIAIQQSQLYQRLQDFNTRLEQQVHERTLQLQQSLTFESALKRITDKVRDSLDEQQILQTAVNELGRVLSVDCCNTGVYSADLTTTTINCEWVRQLPPVQGITLALSVNPDLYGQLLQRRTIHGCLLEPWALRPTQQRYAVLACPVFDDQGILGDIWLFKPPHHHFEASEIRLVEQVANQCAIALRQSRLYKAAQDQVAALETLHQLKDDFLSTVSHELRSPVTNMKMAIQVLALTLNRIEVLDDVSPYGEPCSDPVAQYLRILDRECEREITLINDLLDLQRLDAGAQPVITEVIDLTFLLTVLLESFQERANGRGQTLWLELPDPVPCLISDPVALNRILTELLHNACKYTPPGERIVIRVQQVTPDRMQLSVTNYGAEIPAHELPRIFDKFYRVTQGDRWRQGGTGLGLALVKKLVEHLQGQITVTSDACQTCFRVDIPLDMTQGLPTVWPLVSQAG